ncbi:MAG: hypothetical protein ABFD64_02905 [Armatimonadota bacterium]
MSRLTKNGVIKLNGKEYKISFDLAAIMDFEEKTGKLFLQVIKPVIEAVLNIRNGEIFKALIAMHKGEASPADIADVESVAIDVIRTFIDSGGIAAADVATLLWAAMGGADIDITPRDAARLIRGNNAVEIFRELFGAISQTVPTADESDESEEPENSDDPNSTSSTG